MTFFTQASRKDMPTPASLASRPRMACDMILSRAFSQSFFRKAASRFTERGIFFLPDSISPSGSSLSRSGASNRASPIEPDSASRTDSGSSSSPNISPEAMLADAFTASQAICS